MSHQLATLLADKLSSGLQRRSVQRPSNWALAYRMMDKGPWKFDRHTWLVEPHNAICEKIVAQKAAQMGFTEWALNFTFYHIDVRAASVLYVLPSESDASDFSSGRFDPALELSTYLSKIFSDVKNVGLKRAGSASLYVRGSRSKSKLKSIPVGVIVLDELEEMMQSNIPLAIYRTAGQESRHILMISTPRMSGKGINEHFNETTQEQFFFRCPHCSKMTQLTFPECLVVTAEELTDPRINDSHLICKECKHKLDNAAKPEWLSIKNTEWVPAYPGRDARGFHISQLYSMMAVRNPVAIAKDYVKAQFDPTEEQEFYNSTLGLTHLVDGAEITDEQIQQCLSKNYTKFEGWTQGGIVTMGVDVGHTFNHVEICLFVPPDIGTMNLSILSKARVLWEGKVRSFEELDQLMRKFMVNFCVVDSQPARREALTFANRFPGRVRLCNYSSGATGKEIHLSGDNDPEPKIAVDRTSWLDLSLGRFRNKSITLPSNVSPEYKMQIKAPKRIYEKDKNGNPVGRYDHKDNEPDHFAHARNYAEIAYPLAFSQASNQNIENFF
jgi:hypothetical protein